MMDTGEVLMRVVLRPVNPAGKHRRLLNMTVLTFDHLCFDGC